MHIRCLGCGWEVEMETLPSKDFHCQNPAFRHDYRYLWVVPTEHNLRKTQEVIRTLFPSLEDFAVHVARRMPPCRMDGLPLGDIHDSIRNILGDSADPQHVIDLFIHKGYIECFMIGDDPSFTNWPEFRVMFDGYPHCGLGPKQAPAH